MAEQELTVAEAARKLSADLAYIYSLLWAGKLQGRKVNGQWRVSANSVETRLKQRGE